MLKPECQRWNFRARKKKINCSALSSAQRAQQSARDSMYSMQYLVISPRSHRVNKDYYDCQEKRRGKNWFRFCLSSGTRGKKHGFYNSLHNTVTVILFIQSHAAISRWKSRKSRPFLRFFSFLLSFQNAFLIDNSWPNNKTLKKTEREEIYLRTHTWALSSTN